MKINEVYLEGQEEATGSNNPNKIIIHHPEWYGDIVGLNNIMRNMGYYMIGYNYYVRKDGSVWKGRPDWATGANCYGQNTQSIGVCFEGNFEKDKEMPKEQFKSGVELIQHLKNKYGISEVGGHNQYYNTSCPGKNFPLEGLINGTVIETKIFQSNKISGGFKDMNIKYNNGSTREQCYADQKLTLNIGSLDPWESCTQIGVNNGRPIIIYNASSGQKVAFVEYNPNKTY